MDVDGDVSIEPSGPPHFFPSSPQAVLLSPQHHHHAALHQLASFRQQQLVHAQVTSPTIIPISIYGSVTS